MILFYQERNGDYLAIDSTTNSYYLQNFGKDMVEGRATAIENNVGSVCTTSMAKDFLRTECKRVAKRKVPAPWLKAIGL